MLDALSNAVGNAKDSVSNAASGVVDGAKDAVSGHARDVAKAEIKKHTGDDIDVVFKDVPADWMNWMIKTGCNSLCVDQTWGFMDDEHKKKLWKERGITKIIMTVEPKPDEDDGWISAWVDWEKGSHEILISWYPRAGNWSSSNAWDEGGYKCWWNLCDEITFGCQLYQLEGECFYKSDWLEGFEDPDPDSMFPNATKKFKRWFEFRHWIIYWYEESRWGWNWKATKNPPPLPDGSLFNLNAVLSLPGMPNFQMPAVKLPNLPDVSLPSLPDAPSLPSLPSLPSISAPSLPSLSMPTLSMPTLSAPSLSAPDLSKLSLPKAPKRPKGHWSAHGFIELEGLNICAKGNKVIFSDATITHFWQDGDGYSVKHEKKEHQRLELETTNDEQAKSWVKSLVASGVKEGEVGGCCSVA